MSESRLVGVKVVEDRTAETPSDRGFLRVRRWVLKSAYDDGTEGPAYPYDVVEREALDAVAIAVHDRGPGGTHVWLRRCLRPPLLSRTRGGVHVPVPWPEGAVTLLEVPAGLVDPGEHGWEGVCRAAAREVAEETGLAVDPEAVRALGAPFLLSPGVLGEMVFPVAVEVAADAVAAPDSHEEVERGAEAVRLPLAQALAQATDAKTEILLRRLRETLSSSGS